MSGAVPLNDAQTHKSALREQARKNRVAQKNKDEISLQIVQAFMTLYGCPHKRCQAGHILRINSRPIVQGL